MRSGDRSNGLVVCLCMLGVACAADPAEGCLDDGPGLVHPPAEHEGAFLIDLEPDGEGAALVAVGWRLEGSSAEDERIGLAVYRYDFETFTEGAVFSDDGTFGGASIERLSSGASIVIWSAGRELFAAERVAGEWAHTRVAEDASGWRFAAGEGDAGYLVWTSLGETINDFDLNGARYAGGRWTPDPSLRAADLEVPSASWQLALTPSGAPILAWSDSTPNDRPVELATPVAGVWRERVLEGSTGRGAERVQPVFDASGRAVLAWRAGDYDARRHVVGVIDLEGVAPPILTSFPTSSNGTDGFALDADRDRQTVMIAYRARDGALVTEAWEGDGWRRAGAAIPIDPDLQSTFHLEVTDAERFTLLWEEEAPDGDLGMRVGAGNAEDFTVPGGPWSGAWKLQLAGSPGGDVVASWRAAGADYVCRVRP